MKEGEKDRKRSILVALSIIVLLCIAIGTVVFLLKTDQPARGKSASLQDRKLLAVGEAQFPPFIFQENGEAKGFDIDLLKEIARRKNLKLTFRMTDWTSAMQAVRNGAADILIGVSDLEERRAYLGFSERMLSMKSSLFVNTDTYAFIRLEDIGDGTPLGVEKGDITSLYLLKTHPEIKQKEYSDQKAVIEALARHEIEVAALDYFSGLLNLQRLKLGSRIKTIGDPILEAAYCFGVKKSDTALLIPLNDGMEELKSDGTIRQLQDRWLGTNFIFNENWQYILYGLVAVAVLAAILLAWNLSLHHAVRRRTQQLAESDELFRLYME
jgi:ABC-type amino acid transport substrate-binding protein